MKEESDQCCKGGGGLRLMGISSVGMDEEVVLVFPFSSV